MSRPNLHRLVIIAIALVLHAGAAHAVNILEIDIDGADDGPVTYNPRFSFGNDTTTASTSAASSAVGLTPADSIFGGDGAAFADTYQYAFTPGVDGDNVALGAGTALNDDGDTVSGIAAGGSGFYRIYVTWPFTNNVSGGDTGYTLIDDVASILFSVEIDQNDKGDEWVFLAEVMLDASTMYTLIQQPTEANSFVSMRAAGVLFDAIGDKPLDVPEPATLLLLGLGLAGLGYSKRRAHQHSA